jgi:3-oxoacyl-[acyl-carrier protein] reductase
VTHEDTFFDSSLRALAETFAAEGASLALTGYSKFDELERWLSEQPWRDRAIALKADVTEPEHLEIAMGAAVEKFRRIDICVANAGKWPAPSLRLDEVEVSRLRDTINVNLYGSLWTARAFMQALARCGPRSDGHGASLTFIGSTAGRFGEIGHVDYSLAKASLKGMVLTLKNEIVHLDPFARVNMVEPGWTITHMAREALNQPGVIERIVRTMPVKQLGRAVDIARAVMLLSSHAASRHISGEVITVAGGMEGRVQWNVDQVNADAIRERLKQE